MELTKTIKRLLSVVLCLVMCFSLLPAAAFADVCDESAQTQEDAAAIPGEDGEIVVGGEDGDLTDGDGDPSGDNDLTDGDDLPGDDSLTDGDPTGGDGLTGDNGLPEGGDEGGALPEGGDLDDGDDALSEGESEPDEDEPSETVVLGLGGGTLTGGADGLADSDTLLAGYFDSLTHSAGGRRKAPAATAGGRLSGPGAQLYAALREKIALVARGELASTAFTVPVSSLELETTAWTLEELGLTDDPIFGEDGYITETASRALNAAVLEEVSFEKVIQALVADHPYELFWYDKTRGCAFNFYITYDGTSLGINELGDFFTYFYVAQEYASDTFAVNRELIQSVNTAAANAKSIVTAHAADADRAKLLAYLTEICALVSYNYDALGENVPYGNPWQLVWVFDGDSATNVVCEGYAKAFQYLCDLSAFASNRVRCLSVSGLMSGGTGAGRHMWNVVRLDNGVNYLVDATNCDDGSIGAPDALFLAVPTGGDAESGYTFSAYGYEIDYSYDEDLLDLYDAEDLAIGVPPARPVTTSGSCGAEGDNLTWTLYEDGELVIEGTGGMQDYTRGGAPWYAYRDAITRAVFEEGVTSISEEAFFGCNSLTTVSLPNTLTSLNSWSFNSCGITEIFIPASVNWISASAFYFTQSLQRIDVDPDNQSYMSVDGVVFSKDGTVLEQYPDARQGAYSVPEGVTTIGPVAFYSSNGLTGLTLPSTLTTIKHRAFYGVGISSVLIPASVTTIESGAFAACDSLTAFAVEAGGAFTADEQGALYTADMTVLVQVPAGFSGAFVIPAGVREIHGDALHGANGITSVYIPAGVTKIGRAAFAFLSGLTSVTYEGSEDEWALVAIEDGNDALSEAEIHFTREIVSRGNCGADAINLTWKLYDDGELVIEGTGEMKFYTSGGAPWYENRELITAVTVREGVSSIAEKAFYGCDKLASLSLPSSLEKMPAGVLINCDALAEVTVAEGNARFRTEEGVVYDGSTLLWCPRDKSGSFAISLGTKKIGNSAFAGCAALTGITIPSGVTYLDYGAFSGCTSLQTVALPLTVESIRYDVFSGCGALTDVFFDGTRDQWNTIEIAGGNDALSAAVLHLGAYVIRFKPNGGENAPEPQTKRHGEPLTLPTEIPTRPDYTFLGWSAAANAETADYLPGGSYTADGDATLYAVWKLTYTLSFRTNGASEAEPADISLTEADGAVTLPGLPARTYYTFTGWNTAADGTGETFDGTADAQALIAFADEQRVVTLYARWELLRYTIVFDPNGGEGETEAQPMHYSIAAQLNANAFTRAGYTFTGWNTRPDGKGTAYGDGAEVNNLADEEGAVVTLYARWKANSYTVHFDANNGTGTMKDLAMTYGKAKALTANVFKKTNWQFVGWSEDPEAKEPTYADKQTVSDLTEENGGAVTLYVVWVKNSYRILFNANGGTGDMSEESAWCEYDGTYTLPRCGYTRAGFDFLGWATAAKGKVVYDDAAQISALTAKNGKVITLYAVWRAHRYSISFDGNGATSGGTKGMNSLACGKAYTLTANGFTRKGYTFLGWSEDENAAEATYKNKQKGRNFSTADGDTVKLYAVWTPTVYKITYKNVVAADGNTNPATYTVKGAITLTDPVRSGSRFDGWYYDAAFAKPVEGTLPDETTAGNQYIPSGTTGAKTLYAKWTVDEEASYTITFDANNGTEAKKEMKGCVFGKNYTLTANAFKCAGYKFDGWVTENGKPYTDRQKNVSFDQDTTLYAVWTPVTYKITYKNIIAFDGNPNITTYTVESDEWVLNDPTRPGSEFGGWYYDAKFKKPVEQDENEQYVIRKGSTGNKTLYAKWSGKVTYTIRFDPNSVDISGKGLLSPVKGTMKSLTKRTNGTVYTLTKNAFKCAGYTFKGWMTEDGTLYGNKAKVGNLADANGTVTLYAVWEPTAYTITYKNVAGARVPGKTSYTIEESYVLPVPEKEGCVFLGWYTSATFKASTRIRELGPGATGNKTLYAKWMLKADPAGDSGGDSLPTG